MKKTLIVSGIILVAAIITLVVINKIVSKKDASILYVESIRGQFDIIVTTTGELQAKQSTEIYGPEMAQGRNFRSMEIKITDLVPEGTEVKQGDYVATLDRTSFDNSLKEELEKLRSVETNMEMKLLDTTVTLSNLRDNVKNLTYTVEEAEITLQQSKYEPPTTIRQAELSLDKAKRSLEQSQRSYSLKVEQAKSDIRSLKANLVDQRIKVSDLQEVLSNFVIKAPSAGMIIYKRDRGGSKRKIGSSINPWDNVVATLPDMTSMISKTYVNEIDVSKVKLDQKVEIIVDAFPDKSYSGFVRSVANIGEQLPNADAKVFEVTIEVEGSDPILRPSMTTGNKIITKTIPDVIYIPMECVQAGTDSIPFVYMKNRKKQIVVLGDSNENDVIIEQGLNVGEKIYLSIPEDAERFNLVGQELISAIKDKAKALKEEEKRIRMEAEKAKVKRGGTMHITPEMINQFQNNRNRQPRGEVNTRDTSSARPRRNLQQSPQNRN
ncbi:MAG: RND transporter [Bacteroidetes bacterium HGW-Bacteroidetes-8]|jgi:multidrug efflux pump subunit AcrA (membrane-fusion protein)|nr:MAG: RND transporter [Bacteroidetes bacterium HGW-Bacteroidetes-8]